MNTNTTYTTATADTWDLISYKLYGTETHMDKLIQANPKHQYTITFDAGTILNIPKTIPKIK